MRLYFLRHGVALNRQDWKGDDFSRPLTEECKERMKRSAIAIAELGLEPDAVITSPLVRAHQTATIVAAGLHAKDKVLPDARLGPGFDPDQLAAILRDHPDSKSLMLVGHEPGMSTANDIACVAPPCLCPRGARNAMPANSRTGS